MGKVKIKLSASEHLAFARILPLFPGDLSKCPVTQAAQREGLRSILKKVQGRIIDGLKKENNLSLSTNESWAIYTVGVEIPRELLDTYQNMILDKIVRTIHQQYQ